MEYKATAKNIKMSPRKVRLVADTLRNGSADSAIKKLKMTQKRAASPLTKVINSAIANAVNNSNAKKETLMVKELRVDEGVTYKRYRFASRGRIAPILHRTSHITVILEDKTIETKPTEEKVEVKEDVKKTKKVEKEKGVNS